MVICCCSYECADKNTLANIWNKIDANKVGSVELQVLYDILADRYGLSGTAIATSSYYV
jgi:hypothetical protein